MHYTFERYYYIGHDFSDFEETNPHFMFMVKINFYDFVHVEIPFTISTQGVYAFDPEHYITNI